MPYFALSNTNILLNRVSNTLSVVEKRKKEGI